MTGSSAETSPFYLRVTCFLLSIALLLCGLYWAQAILIPVLAAMLLAFLVLPLVGKLQRWRLPNWLAALLGVLAVLAVGIALFGFLSWQILSFSGDMPMMQSALEQKGSHISTYIEQQFNVSRETQSEWLRKKRDTFIDEGANSAMNIFTATGAAVAGLALIPFFMFFMLLYREKFKKSIEFLAPESHEKVLEVIRKIAQVSQQYLQGMLLVILILSVLNSIGFLFLGLKYAVLLAFIAGVLNIIPYVGVMIGSLIPVAIALVTKESPMYAVGAFGVCMFVQFLENNFITPKIVGSSVNLNPLSSLLALLMGGLIWGLPGMVFAIPMAGIFKVICDNVEKLRLYGFLLGEEAPAQIRKLKYARGTFGKKVKVQQAAETYPKN
ncbi:AI-2E family transporter [Haliscomenobacter sp.]|uniref:AI-2E family transporter n=1 Tax=Haliscomenobacter sp. TaxID=2717303 RepID=UPI003BAD77B7